MSYCNVTVKVADGISKVEIIDGSFHVIGSNFGALSMPLAPGIYKTRAIAAGTVTEKLFDVDASTSSLDLSLDAPRFSTPVPLRDTVMSTPDFRARLHSETRSPNLDLGLGSGAGLTVSILAPSGQARRIPESWSDVAFGRKSVIDDFFLFGSNYARSLRRDHFLYPRRTFDDWPDDYAVINVQTSAGYYLLAYHPKDKNEVVIPVPVLDGWRSQLFLRVDYPNEGKGPGYVDLVDRSLLMTPVDEPFDTEDPRYRMTEIVRRALTFGHAETVPDFPPDVLLDAALASPMLALLSAQLLLAKDSPDVALLGNLLGRLIDTLGEDFADVVALRIALSKLKDSDPALPITGIPFPPLLRTSWNLIAEFPTLTPKGSLAYQAASQIEQTNPWFSWKTPLPSNAMEGNIGAPATWLSNPTLYDVPAIVGNDDFMRGWQTENVPEDEATAQTAIKDLAQLIGGADAREYLKSTQQGLEFLSKLTEVQRSLLPRLQFIRGQLEQRNEFTLDDLRALRRDLFVPMPVLRDNAKDMLIRIHGMDSSQDPTSGTSMMPFNIPRPHSD